MGIGLKRGTVVVEPHKSEWESTARQTIELLKSIFLDVAVDVQHVGSTAIRGICAKPIIDIVVGVSDLNKMLALNDVLEQNGILFRGQDHPGQYLYICGKDDWITHHIHTTTYGSEAWHNYVNMRDYLISHPDEAQAYSKLKESLAVQYAGERKTYTAMKGDFINNILTKAREWRKRGNQMQLCNRKDVPEELKWDLSLLFEKEEQMWEKLEQTKGEVEGFVKTYSGRLNTAGTIVKCLQDMEGIELSLSRIWSYSGLAVETDYTDNALRERDEKVGDEITHLYSEMAFVDSEILLAPEEELEEAVKIAKGCRVYLEDLIAKKAHMLSPETEKVLTALDRSLEVPYTIYNTMKLADIAFDPFTVEGKEYQLGYSLFEDNYELEADTAVRRAAARAFYGTLAKYKNTTAAAYNACVTYDKTMSELRRFDNVFDSLLLRQKVTREMYERQIDVITERLAPHMRRYARLLQKKYGLDKMTFADLKISVDPEYDPKVTIEESHRYIREGLSILGPDYVDMIDRAYSERWIDFARNIGKSTGGFCSDVYRQNSYILLNWNDRMADVFTLAHELGHAGQDMYGAEAQSSYESSPSMYLIEAPSTMNELLLANHLLKTSDDKRFRRWVLSNMVSNTYYHNFVTHLREAWYQREVYRIIDEGGSVNADVLSDLFRKNLELFWGDAVEIQDGAELTWMRQPHYYMGLYSYTYSAGLTLATQAMLRIQKEGESAVRDWKNFLSAGGTKDPAGLALIAGCDITTDGPLNATIDYIGSLIEEIISLTEEIDGITI